MRLTLPEPLNLETDGFTSKNDIFGYKQFGERLADLVSNINQPLVITLDGPWGSGKSVFIKQWVGLMRGRGGSVVYFDAFSNDFHSDAFSALTAEIYSIANKTLGKKSDDFLKKANKASRVLASKGFDIVLRLGTGGTVDTKDIGDVVMALKNESEKAISEQLKKADEERASLEAFRNALSDVAKSIADKNPKKGHSLPLVFVVDELDRCRPLFALDVIERIKHLFSVENVCFVLVTNLTHLEAVVKKTYGMETKARTYLEKFYHLRVMLPEITNEKYKQRDKYLLYLWTNLNLKFRDARYYELVREEIRFLGNAYELSLREIEHVMTNVVFVAATTNENQWIIPPVVAGLCIMKQKDYSLYARARRNDLTMEDVKKFLKINEGDYANKESLAGGREWALNWWRYFIDPDAPQELVDKFSADLVRFNIVDHRLSFLPILTNYIDNISIPPAQSS